VECTGEKRNVYRILVGKPKGRSLLGILGRRQQLSYKWFLKKVCKKYGMDSYGSG
jgi:hypothetical protein